MTAIVHTDCDSVLCLFDMHRWKKSVRRMSIVYVFLTFLFLTMKQITLLLLTLIVIVLAIPQQGFAQPENNCQNEAEQIPCADPWNIYVESVWVDVPGVFNCRIKIDVFFFGRCNVYSLISTSYVGPAIDDPDGCMIGNYHLLDAHAFHTAALAAAIGQHVYQVNGLPPCGQTVPTQTNVFTANCLRSVIEYKTLIGNTVTINYNPALGYEHYRQLIISLTGIQSPELTVKTEPCGDACCKQDVAYCLGPDGKVVTMQGTKTLITGSCDPDPELYCRSSNCE